MAAKIIGLDKLKMKLQKLQNIKSIEQEIKDGTRLIQNTAKDIVPVDTGTLKNSIKVDYDPQKQEGKIYTTLEYAPYIEFGTRRSRAQPFLLPAFNINIQSIKNSIKLAIKNSLNSIANGRS